MTETQAVFCAFKKMVPVDQLIPNPKNPNKHPRGQVDLLAKIIANNGWRAPITVSTRSGYVVRGHGRLDAAKALGVAEVPVDYQDYENEAKEMADMLADNKIASLAELDLPMVKDILVGLDDGSGVIDLTGFTEVELQGLIDRGAVALPELSGETEKLFEQMTFTLSVDQAALVKAALKLAQEAGEFPDKANENRNGNALARIVRAYKGEAA